MQSPPFPRYLVPPRSKYSPQHHVLFSNTPSFLSSRNNNDQVSHPYKTTGKIIVLYILIFNDSTYEYINIFICFSIYGSQPKFSSRKNLKNLLVTNCHYFDKQIKSSAFCKQSGLGRDFPPVQTGPGAHPALCKMGTWSFPGVKCGRGVLLTTHPLLVPRSWKSRDIPLSTLWATPGR